MRTRQIEWSHANRLLTSCLVWVALHSATVALWAGPPFVTDDPEPVEYKHWEVYLAGLYNHETGREEGMLPMVEVNYGVLPDMQLHLIAPGAYVHEGGDRAHYGYGDTELGIKYRFVHETDTLPQIGTFPLVEAPTGNESLGLGNGKTQVFLPLWLQKSLGKWTAYGGGGWWHNPGTGNQDFWRFGGVLQRKISDKLALGSEVYHETGSGAGEDGHTAFNLGGTYDFTEHQHLLFSAGRDFYGPVRFACYLAWQFTF